RHTSFSRDWSSDVCSSDLTMVAVQLLIYGAYFTLRTTVDDPGKRARIAGVYNLFAAVTLPFLLYVIPRQMDSLHPGAEGNPAFRSEERRVGKARDGWRRDG